MLMILLLLTAAAAVPTAKDWRESWKNDKNTCAAPTENLDATVVVGSGSPSSTATGANVATFAACSAACLKTTTCMYFTFRGIAGTADAADTCIFYTACKPTDGDTASAHSFKLYSRPCWKPANATDNPITDSFPAASTLTNASMIGDLVLAGYTIEAKCDAHKFTKGQHGLKESVDYICTDGKLVGSIDCKDIDERQWNVSADDRLNTCAAPADLDATVVVGSGSPSSTATGANVATFAACSAACLKTTTCMYFTFRGIAGTADAADTCIFYTACKPIDVDANPPFKLYTRPCVKTGAIADSYPSGDFFTWDEDVLADDATVKARCEENDLTKYKPDYFNSKGGVFTTFKCTKGKLTPNTPETDPADPTCNLKCLAGTDFGGLTAALTAANAKLVSGKAEEGYPTEQVEVTCKSNYYTPDGKTEKFKATCDATGGIWNVAKTCQPIFGTNAIDSCKKLSDAVATEFYQLQYRTVLSPDFIKNTFIGLEDTTGSRSEIVKKEGAAVDATDPNQVFQVIQQGNTSPKQYKIVSANENILAMSTGSFSTYFYGYSEGWEAKYPGYSTYKLFSTGSAPEDFGLLSNWISTPAYSVKENETKLGSSKSEIAVCLKKVTDTFLQCGDFPLVLDDDFSAKKLRSSVAVSAKSLENKQVKLKCDDASYGADQIVTCEANAARTSASWSKVASEIAACTTKGSKLICATSTLTLTGEAFLDKTGTFDQAAVITVKCPENYDYTDASAKKWTCGKTNDDKASKWKSTPDASKWISACERKTCSAENAIQRGNVVLSGADCADKTAVDVGKKCSLKCDDNHYGTAELTEALECEAVKGWKPLKDSSSILDGCLKKKCNPNTGSYIPTAVKFVKTADKKAFTAGLLIDNAEDVTAQCKDGWNGAHKDGYKCDDGKIDVKIGGTPIYCKKNKCTLVDTTGAADFPKHVEIKNSKTTYDADKTADLTCKTGYEGTNQTYKCNHLTGMMETTGKAISCSKVSSETAQVSAIATVVAGAALMF